MNKILVSFLFVFIVSVSNAQTIDLDIIRNDFNKGVKDEALCKEHYNTLRKYAKSDVEKGYAATFQMFMAKHTGNPFKKMSYFNGGKGSLEKLIKSNPQEPELRFMRLCIQYHLPKYLGYRDSIEEDKDFMLENLYKMKDKETKALLFKYLKGANMYTEQELVLLGR